MFECIGANHLDIHQGHTDPSRNLAPCNATFSHRIDAIDDDHAAQIQIRLSQRDSHQVSASSHVTGKNFGSTYRLLDGIHPQISRVQPGCQSARDRGFPRAGQPAEDDEHFVSPTSAGLFRWSLRGQARADGLIRLSAGMPNISCSFQIIGKVRERLPLSTS
ncbi:hypothetical protein D9M70_552440 [compost metagenome]